MPAKDIDRDLVKAALQINFPQFWGAGGGNTKNSDVRKITFQMSSKKYILEKYYERRIR